MKPATRITKMPVGESGTALLTEVRDLIRQARQSVARNVNLALVCTNFHVGRLIVEHEQKGQQRAEYAQKLIQHLAARLSDDFGRGYSASNLKYMRQFYLMFGKSQTLSGKCCNKQDDNNLEKSQKPSGELIASGGQGALANLPTPAFTLTWSAYIFLMQISNPDERRFYEIEATTNNWSLRELRRQFDSSLYERLALSRDKAKVRALAEKGHIVEKPEDMLKSPYVLEFLNLREEAAYSENDLESAIIDKLEGFLLELGKGFLFEARQKRITVDGEHYHIDLVFYNRLLRCYVLIDLKIGKLTHQDLGQMQMYVHYFDRFVRTKGENPTIGIVLCKQKGDTLVEITLPEHCTQIFARKYQLYLPSKDELRAQVEALDRR